MREDCIQAVKSSLPNKCEKAVFLPHRTLHPPWKGGGPFQSWALDCIVGLKPPALDGSTTVVVGVDSFTKWVEIAPLPTRHASQVAAWFHS